MTFVDDNLLGTSPIRSTKSGLKTAGKAHDMEAAGQRSAFENAFADAGKKKQPVISIGGKAAVEAALPANQTVLQNLKVADAEKHAPDAESAVSEENIPSKNKNVDGFAAETGEDDQSSLQRLISENDDFMKPTIGNSADTVLRMPVKKIPAPDVEQHSMATEETDRPLEFAMIRPGAEGSLLPSISLAGVGEDATTDAGKTLEGPMGEKVVGLLKDAKAIFSKHKDPAEQINDTKTSHQKDEVDAASDATSADVSQLLTLLDAPKTPAAASQIVRPETTPAMSEFQALAERAGKAKTAPKDTAAANADARVAGDVNAVKNAAQAGSDQVFRFARADGKGHAVSMNLASDGDKTVVKNDAPVAGSKAEAVTVLEARRYLGLAPAGNAAAVTSQIAGNPEWARALQPSTAASTPVAQASTGKVLNTLKIQMHPIDLGTVTATLRLKDDELHVEIKVETGDAFRQLSDDQNAMVKALRAQGFAVDQVNIVFNSSDSASSNSQQQAQPQTGQQGREASGDGTAQGKGQRNDNGGQEQARERWTGNEGKSDAASGAELNRAGDVYM